MASDGVWPVFCYAGKNGIKLVADVAGPVDRPCVILLHGGGQTRHSWSGAMRSLVGKGYHVINLDARGHGDSEWDADGDYSHLTLSEDLACVIATLQSPPVLVGASMGGATSLCLLGSEDAPKASALVMVDIVPSINPTGAERIRAFMVEQEHGFADLQEAADAIAAYNPHRPPSRDNSGLLKNLRLREDGRLYWHWDPRLLTTGWEVEPPMQFENLRRAAANVRIPVLLVRGLRSDIVTDKGVADFIKLTPQLEVCNIADAGHMVAGDKNDAFNQAIFDFLKRHHPILPK